MKNLNLKAFVTIGMLSSISYVLMLLNFPLPPFPNFLMIDFSDLPALIAAFILGPGAAVLVELFKNILDYFMTGSATGVPVGHFANFLAGIIFVLPTYYIYNKLKTRKGLAAALITGTFAMAILMSVLNYFVIMPAYTLFLNMPAMEADALRTMIVTGILPFNVLKGLLMAGVFMLLFARMGPWIAKQQQYRSA